MTSIIRFQFSKGPEVQFLSHLDLLRAMERALRRAKLPIAFSEGFSPRPIMGFSYPLPVGVLSEAEYGDFKFAEPVEPQEFVERFNGHLPPGFRVLAAERLAPGAQALQSAVNAASWKVVVPQQSVEDLEEVWLRLQAVDSVVVERQTKKGTKRVDLRPLFLGIDEIEESSQGTVVHCYTSLGKQGNLRLDELALLLAVDPTSVTVTRTGQYRRVGSCFQDPLGKRGFTWTAK